MSIDPTIWQMQIIRSLGWTLTHKACQILKLGHDILPRFSSTELDSLRMKFTVRDLVVFLSEREFLLAIFPGT